jgi:glycosyltransferase involved in cell wall biosynthesis
MTAARAQDARTESKVSVIMNCLNGEKYVKAAIESVYAQSYPNWEIIFLDNASSDSTPAIVRGFDDRLRYFRNDRTVPLGEARNQALKQAQGEYIAFLDSDDLWMPAKLAKQIPLFKDRPGLGLVFSDTEMRYAETGRRTTYFGNHHYKPPRGRIFSALLLHYSIPMLTAVIRAQALRGMEQWFDSKYVVCDDFDFFMRLAYDWECDYVDEPLASLLLHGESVTIKMHRFGPGEMTQTIEKFRRRYPDFEKRFFSETSTFLKVVSFKQGKSYWRDGNTRAARTEFGKHLLSPKFFLGYIATAFPFETAEKISRWIGR